MPMIADLFVWYAKYVLMGFVAVEFLFLACVVVTVWPIERQMLRDLRLPDSFRQGRTTRK